MMDMKLTALGVNQGDSYLLEYGNKKVLVDGGDNVQELSGVPDILDLVVCTHFDKDHVAGLINLLKQREHRIKELWIPDEMSLAWNYVQQESAYLISLELLEAVELYLNYPWEEIKSVRNSILEQNSLARYRNGNENHEKKDSTETNIRICTERYGIDNIGRLKAIQQSAQTTKELYSMADGDINEECDNESIEQTFARVYYELLFAFISAAEIKTQVRNNNVRWFRYDKTGDYMKGESFGQEIRVINAYNVNSRISKPLTAYALNFLNISRDNNKRNVASLALLFDKNDVPNILFCGDSNLEWLNNKAPLRLKNGTIVTAPHHGSKTGARAYSTEYVIDENDTNDNLVFIRSDSVHTPGNKNRPCMEYTKMKVKYCRCCVPSIDKTTSLEYSGQKLIVVANKCNCAYKV